jgi:uncharacterized SAM-binding protein YcdF (DUF218 family)
VWSRLGGIIGILFLVIAASRFYIEYRAVTQTRPSSWYEDTEADCAVALTGGSGRVKEGVDLLYRGAVKKLIVSGVHPKVNWRQILPQWPFYGEAREENVVLERRSNTTYGNAVQTLPLVEALHCRSIAIVTSTWHMHRAYKSFRAIYPPDFPIAIHAVVSGNLNPDRTEVLLETFKSLFYSLWAY